MRTVIQRVTSARVEVENLVVGSIGLGLIVYLGAAQGDTEHDCAELVRKIVQCRIFENDAGKLDKCLLDVNGAMLVVSQFTLLANLSKGRRPSFEEAMEPVAAKACYETFIRLAKETGLTVQTGIFGATMDVIGTCHGPMTILMDTRTFRGKNLS